jgi:CheY-like chemotaxis protein
MTTGNEHSTHGGAMLPRREAAPVAPLIAIGEQQPAVRELLSCMLHLAGYRTWVFAGREAFLTGRAVQALPAGEIPAALLLDLSLHSASEAQEYLHRVRCHWLEACTDLPAIIVLTTQPQVQAALFLRERVLLMPFHVHDLLARTQQAAPVRSTEEVGTS